MDKLMDRQTDRRTRPLLEMLDAPDHHLCELKDVKAMLEIGIFSLFQTLYGQTFGQMDGQRDAQRDRGADTLSS